MEKDGSVYATLAYIYDANGNKTGVTDAKGNTTTYGYDANGELAYISREADSTRLTYDAEGNCLSQTNPLGETIAYTYDSENRLKTVTHPDQNGEPVTISYEYDLYGRNTGVIDEEGNTARKTYDKNGNLLTVEDGMGNLAENRTYDSNNQLLTVTDALGVTDRYTYDVMGNLTGIVAQADTSVEQETKYRYNQDGSLSKVEDAKEGISAYTYDTLGNWI